MVVPSSARRAYHIYKRTTTTQQSRTSKTATDGQTAVNYTSLKFYIILTEAEREIAYNYAQMMVYVAVLVCVCVFVCEHA